jgi:hypothetical protein
MVEPQLGTTRGRVLNQTCGSDDAAGNTEQGRIEDLGEAQCGLLQVFLSIYLYVYIHICAHTCLQQFAKLNPGR